MRRAMRRDYPHTVIATSWRLQRGRADQRSTPLGNALSQSLISIETCCVCAPDLALHRSSSPHCIVAELVLAPALTPLLRVQFSVAVGPRLVCVSGLVVFSFPAMSEELSMKDLQMKGLTEKIEMMLKGLDKSKRQELDLAEIGSRLRDFQTALDGAQLELKHLGAHMQKNEFTKLLRDHKSTLKELKNEYDWRKANSDSNALMDGAKPGATAADMTTADGMMRHGLEVQDRGTESLQRTLRVVGEAKDIGIDTVAKLDANTHQIEAMYGEDACTHAHTQTRTHARTHGAFTPTRLSEQEEHSARKKQQMDRKSERCSAAAFVWRTVSHPLALCLPRCLLPRSDNLTAIDTTLARSTKVIKRMARKMATDKSANSNHSEQRPRSCACDAPLPTIPRRSRFSFVCCSCVVL